MSSQLHDHTTNQRRRLTGAPTLSLRLRWTSRQVSQAPRHSDINHGITPQAYGGSFRKEGEVASAADQMVALMSMPGLSAWRGLLAQEAGRHWTHGFPHLGPGLWEWE